MTSEASGGVHPRRDRGLATSPDHVKQHFQPITSTKKPADTTGLGPERRIIPHLRKFFSGRTRGIIQTPHQSEINNKLRPKSTNPEGNSLDDAHGTAVAGVAGARGDNGVGVTGVAQNVRILPVRIGDESGFATGTTLANAVYYAAGAWMDPETGIIHPWRGADVINASWRTGTHPALTAAIDWAATQGRYGLGVPFFAASGNFAAGFARPQYVSIALPPVSPPAGTYSWLLSYW